MDGFLKYDVALENGIGDLFYDAHTSDDFTGVHNNFGVILRDTPRRPQIVL